MTTEELNKEADDLNKKIDILTILIKSEPEETIARHLIWLEDNIQEIQNTLFSIYITVK